MPSPTHSEADALVRELLAQGSESDVDYKGPVPFPTDSVGRASTAKDIIGWSNTRDGGYLLVGVDDATYLAVGLSEADALTWDQADVSQSVSAFASPVPVIRIFRGHAENGALLVAVRIVAFQDQPIVCVRGQLDTGKRILTRVGALYVRTHASQTKEITTEAELRALLELAYVKKSELLLRQIKDLIDAHWPGTTTDRLASASARIDAALSTLGYP
jgi:predicted HTH transcriptional regulator